MADTKKIGEKIKYLRINKGLTQQQLAEEIGYKTDKAISFIENGERELSIEKLKAISDFFNIPISEFTHDEKIVEKELFFALRKDSELAETDVKEITNYIDYLKNKRREQMKIESEDVNFKNIEKLAEKYIKKSKLSIPLNLNDFIEYLQVSKKILIDLTPKSLSENFSGIFIKVDPEVFGIMFNQNHHQNRQRFTIAHELGHMLLNHDIKGEHIETMNLSSKDPLEKEANHFAACLLMPRKFLKDDVLKTKLTNKELAQKYLVSEEAMKWRSFQMLPSSW